MSDWIEVRASLQTIESSRNLGIYDLDEWIDFVYIPDLDHGFKYAAEIALERAGWKLREPWVFDRRVLGARAKLIQLEHKIFDVEKDRREYLQVQLMENTLRKEYETRKPPKPRW